MAMINRRACLEADALEFLLPNVAEFIDPGKLQGAVNR